MRKRYLFWSGLALLAILVTLVVWQVSFSFGDYGPADAGQTFVFWAVSTLIFLLTVTLGFMLFRTGVKLYLERQANREGSRIKTKLLAGALALSLLPVVFLALFSYVILNRNVENGSAPPKDPHRSRAEQQSAVLRSARPRRRAGALDRSLPEVDDGTADFEALCRDNNIASLELRAPDPPFDRVPPATRRPLDCSLPPLPSATGILTLAPCAPAADMQRTQSEIDRYMSEYGQLAAQKKTFARSTCCSSWPLRSSFFRRHLDRAAALAPDHLADFRSCWSPRSEVRKGNLSHRVSAKAVDELADAGPRLQRNDAGARSQ